MINHVINADLSADKTSGTSRYGNIIVFDQNLPQIYVYRNAVNLLS